MVGRSHGKLGRFYVGPNRIPNINVGLSTPHAIREPLEVVKSKVKFADPMSTLLLS